MVTGAATGVDARKPRSRCAGSGPPARSYAAVSGDGAIRAPGRGRATVYVVDNQAVVRAGLRRMLEEAGGFEVVGEAGDAEEGLRGILETESDLALVDMRLPGGDGVEILRELRARRSPTRCLVMAGFPDEAAFFQAVVVGAAGYILKDQPLDELVAACRRVAEGGSLLSPQALDDLRERIAAAPRPDRVLADLTPQERRILQFVSEGMTNREIADRLELAEKTVRNYVSNILTKMDMKNRTMAAAYVATSQARASAYRAIADGVVTT